MEPRESMEPKESMEPQREKREGPGVDKRRTSGKQGPEQSTAPLFFLSEVPEILLKFHGFSRFH